MNAVRATAGLAAATFTDPTITAGTTKTKALHLSELRNALSTALTTLGFPSPTFTAGLAAASQIKAVHVQELRTLVK